jgi:hypothetical protein
MEPIQDAGKRIREWQKAKFGDHGVTMMPTVEVTMEPIQDDYGQSSSIGSAK